MDRVLIICDVSNLYLCGQRAGRKIDYKKLLKESLNGRELYRAVAYGAQMDGEADAFIHFLQSNGFYTKFKTPKVFGTGDKIVRKADWDVGMVVDMISWMDQYNTVAICSADGDFLPVVKFLQSRGRRVEVYGMTVSRDLKDSADSWVDISDFIFEPKDSTNDNASRPVTKLVSTGRSGDGTQ